MYEVIVRELVKSLLINYLILFILFCGQGKKIMIRFKILPPLQYLTGSHILGWKVFYGDSCIITSKEIGSSQNDS